MSRTALFAVTAVLVAASLSAAGISVSTQFYTITVDAGNERKTTYARATGGQLALSERGGWSDWDDRREPRPDRWYVLGTKIKASGGDGYLAYDPSGKDRRVFLSPEAGEGTDWLIGNRKEGQNTFRRGVVRAASGDVRGWYLDVEEQEEKGKNGKPVVARRLVLRRDVPRTRVHVTRLYTYRATAP